MGAHAGAEHRVPTPERLLPEWLGPGEAAVFDHVFITTPDIIHENVDAAGLTYNRRESGIDLRVFLVVAADRGNSLPDLLMIRR